MLTTTYISLDHGLFFFIWTSVWVQAQEEEK